MLPILTTLLSDIAIFTEYASGLKLRGYQLEVARSILDSVLNQRGLTFVVIFPRQSGKNELQAQIETYLLALLYLHDAEIVKISPTWKPQSLNAMRRLERVLQRNHLTSRTWVKEQGYIYRNGAARVFFLSGSPTSNIIGATASTLLECDEAQDVTLEKWDKEISPMAASTNATRVFWGTAWTSHTLLAREKQAALLAQQIDGLRRVFHLTAAEVSREVPAYAVYVSEQIARLGRSHPLIRTQYFSEETEEHSSMFPPSRLALLQGSHPWLPSPGEGSFAFLLDIGSGTESTSQINQNEVLINLKRDSTALTILQIDLSTLSDPLITAPRYLVVHRRLWTGVDHPSLYAQILALTDLWQPRYIVIDSTGIGAGLASFLQRTLNPAGSGGPVVPFLFTQKSKSDLGWAFLALIDTGRFKDHAPTQGVRDPLQAQFLLQLQHCQMEILPGPERRLRWGVPDHAHLPGDSSALIHDDLLVSAALASVLDRLPWGQALSAIIPPFDPLAGLTPVY